MTFRTARTIDALVLAIMNKQLIQDEGHRNPMSLEELEARMRGWLEGEYSAVVFEDSGDACGYALFRWEEDHVYLRQFFVHSDRRRKAIGRAAIRWLVANTWKDAPRIQIDVLVRNTTAIAFWNAVGFKTYCFKMELETRPEGR